MQTLLRSLSAAVVTATAAVVVVGCGGASSPTAPPAAPSEVGRFQVVVATEGERGAVLILVDTKEGETWVYRPPQGQAVNGFWSDIPRLTYPPEFWRRVFTQPPPTDDSTNSRTFAP